MKSTGIIRKVDELGRIVIPAQVRKVFAIGTKDHLEIFTEGDKIVLSKFQKNCYFCSSPKDVRSFKGKKVCAGCRKSISSIN